VGFLLLALSVNSVESIQSFIFYLIQYSITNLNAFVLLITIGYTLYFYINKDINYNNLIDKNNSPVQLVSQLKGYFYINPLIAISLAITIFSFAGIPPLMGFFAKLMVLSAALQDGFVFLTLIGVLTSVIGAVYYLNIIKTMFFSNTSYKFATSILDIKAPALITNNNNTEKVYLQPNITISNAFSITISLLTLIILLFMFIPNE
jgi:NADH-ubiquinone oxidoreductase chain 2